MSEPAPDLKILPLMSFYLLLCATPRLRSLQLPGGSAEAAEELTAQLL